MLLEADECLVVTAQDAFMDTLPDGMALIIVSTVE